MNQTFRAGPGRGRRYRFLPIVVAGALATGALSWFGQEGDALPDRNPADAALETASADDPARALAVQPAAGPAATGPAATGPVTELATLGDAPVTGPAEPAEAIRPPVTTGSIWPEQDFWMPPAEIVEQTVEIRRGDTLMGVLTGAEVPRQTAWLAIEAMTPVLDPRRIRAGQEITLVFSNPPAGTASFTGLRIETDIDRSVVVSHDGKDGFLASEEVLPLIGAVERREGIITSSLYLAGTRAGLPPDVLVDMIHIFSFDVDFQRDIRVGDRFEVMYERQHDAADEVSRNGDILYASLTLSGTELPLWRYPTSEGFPDYFDAEGRSARKALMRTPIDGARLSSSFGMRRHPILGYSRMHQGTDFAAPSGTPIYAAGDGVIATAGRNGGYGNYIRIRHNGTYHTAYAHMRGFARGIGQGVRVQQGQTIGYVGTTGRSTGPHLHYEVLENGSQINSRTMQLPSGEQMTGDRLAAFQTHRAAALQQWAGLVPPARAVADAGDAGDAGDAPTAETASAE